MFNGWVKLNRVLIVSNGPSEQAGHSAEALPLQSQLMPNWFIMLNASIFNAVLVTSIDLMLPRIAGLCRMFLPFHKIYKNKLWDWSFCFLCAANKLIIYLTSIFRWWPRSKSNRGANTGTMSAMSLGQGLHHNSQEKPLQPSTLIPLLKKGTTVHFVFFRVSMNAEPWNKNESTLLHTMGSTMPRVFYQMSVIGAIT